MKAEDFDIGRAYFYKMNNKIFFQGKKYISTALDSSKYNLDCDNGKGIILVEGNNICVKDVPENFLEYVLALELQFINSPEEIRYEEEFSDIPDKDKINYIEWKIGFHKNMFDFCDNNSEFSELRDRHKELHTHFVSKFSGLKQNINTVVDYSKETLIKIIEEKGV